MPLPAASENEQLRWLVASDGGALPDALWYIDGTLLDGHYGSHGRVGFGILALGADDQILAAVYGTPPVWITTVPGAEAWALYAALRHSITAGGVVTDCMGVEIAAQRALSGVVSSRSPLARVWAALRCILDDTGIPVTWMPAYLSLAASASRVRSDGGLVTPRDWRANRLVDALAKQGARLHQVPHAAVRRMHAGAASVLHFGARLGAITRAANNHRLEVLSRSKTDNHAFGEAVLQERSRVLHVSDKDHTVLIKIV